MAIFLISLILVALYFYLTRNYKYWQKRGVPCPDGILPGIGHMWPVASLNTTFSECISGICSDNRSHSMIGVYIFRMPSLIVNETELVKAVLQTNFACFSENAFKLDPELDPLAINNPFVNSGEAWAISRKRMTYAFSSAKLKVLLENTKPVCVMLDNYVDSKLQKAESVELELQNLFSRYAAQMVAASGFSVDGYCFDDEKEKVSFRRLGEVMMDPALRSKIFFSIIFLMPFLSKFLKIGFVPKHIDQFFRTLVSDLMEDRRKDEKPRNPDFLHVMAELERIEGEKFDVQTLASQAFSFVINGYMTSSKVMSFVVYELAMHPEVQRKLREEVMSVLGKYDGAITYEALKEMTYMDQVISESQRVIPHAGFMNKVCTEECELRGSDGRVCRVQPGTKILISIHALHYDPRYWRDPEVFDPERFSPDRKDSIERFAFLPFGDGPRICPAIRMAQMQMKAGLAVVLRKYDFELSPKTQLPLKMKTGSILATPKGGLWAFIRRL